MPPNKIHGSCCFSGLLLLRSLINGPPIGVRFRESLVVRLYSEIDQIHLSIEAQCVSTLLPTGRQRMPNFCTKVMQHVLKQKSETFSWIFKIILGEDLGHIFLMDSQCIVSVIFYHEKDHFLLELLSYTVGKLLTSGF